MTSEEYRASAISLRSLAAKGILRRTVNGATVQYANPKDMVDLADRLEATANQLDGLTRSAARPSRVVFQRG